MKYIFSILAASAIPAMALAAVPEAQMTDAACVALRDQLLKTLEAHPANSIERTIAQHERMIGKSRCLTGYPREGADRYRKALQRLHVKPVP